MSSSALLLPKLPKSYPIIHQQEDLEKLMAFLHKDIQDQVRPFLNDLEEIKIRQGRKLWILTDGRYQQAPLLITLDHLAFISAKCKNFRDDNRRGIDGTGHRISQVLKDNAPIGYTFRVGRYFDGIGEAFRVFIEESPSFLIVGEAGTGKTTILRGIIKIVAEYYPMQMVCVDTSGEMGGAGRIPHPGIGDADIMPVDSKGKQALLIEEAVKNQNVRILGLDEINRRAEAEMIVVSRKSGASLIGTTHGANIQGVLENVNLEPLFFPEPVFYWLVITESRGVYSVYNAREAVSAFHSGQQPRGQVVCV